MESVTVLEQPKASLKRIEIVEHVEKINDRYELKELPENISMFKCPHCRYIFDIFEPQCAPILTMLCDKEDIVCPNCGMNGLELMCKVDSYSVYIKMNDIVSCRRGVAIPGVEICPVCDRAMCPRCFNHDCVALSRVTGYIQSVDGWNVAKKQELLDRKRYDINRDGDTTFAKKVERTKNKNTKKEELRNKREERPRLLREGQRCLSIY